MYCIPFDRSKTVLVNFVSGQRRVQGCWNPFIVDELENHGGIDGELGCIVETERWSCDRLQRVSKQNATTVTRNVNVVCVCIFTFFLTTHVVETCYTHQCTDVVVKG